MMKEDKGILVKVLPDKIIVGAVTQDGLNHLDYLAKSDLQKCSGIRNKFDISELEYPFWTVKQLIKGEVYMIIFTKSNKEEKKNDIQS